MLAGGGSSSIWDFLLVGVTLPQGNLLCTLKEKALLVQQWRDIYVFFVVLWYWSWGEERGTQLGEGQSPIVSPCQGFAFS